VNYKAVSSTPKQKPKTSKSLTQRNKSPKTVPHSSPAKVNIILDKSNIVPININTANKTKIKEFGLQKTPHR
jgi:hypothetical protein